MEFRPTDRVVLLSDSTEIDVNENTLWFSEASMGLKRIDNKFIFDAAGEAIRTIVVVDKDNNRRMKLDISNAMNMNQRYFISAKGM